jgi:hypothetical protein
MTDRDAVCWHCLDCVTVPARTRCEHCPEECDVEGCDAPGCNGQAATVSPWRSLKDYSAPEDIDSMILLRRAERLAWMLCGPLGRKRTIEIAMADGFDEYMEIPS